MPEPRRRSGTLLRPVAARAAFDGAFDWLRFKIDTLTLPRRWLQPLPTLGLQSSKQVESRWEAIHPLVEEQMPRSALDIGCNVGWFAFRLAALGIPTVGVENGAPFYRTSIYALRRSQLRDAGVLVLDVTPRTVILLPEADCVLLLAIWHHFVRDHGLEAATEMLKEIWAKTRSMLLFDTGENEMPSSFGLPAMIPDPKTWVTGYLAGTCDGARVDHLGAHEATAPDGSRVRRNLFALVRVSPTGRVGDVPA
jgi:hypothetical protein